jgi:hypothetical protein
VLPSQRDRIRARYEYRCGYCGVSETDTGGILTLDHHHPRTAGGDDSDENLVYACPRCNQYKGDFWPDVDDTRLGRVVLHPLLSELAQHFRDDEETGQLVPLTETGRFHIALLQLNRPALVQHRLRRRLSELLTAKQRLLEAENAQLRATVAEQERYIALLRALVGPAVEDNP